MRFQRISKSGSIPKCYICCMSGTVCQHLAVGGKEALTLTMTYLNVSVAVLVVLLRPSLSLSLSSHSHSALIAASTLRACCVRPFIACAGVTGSYRCNFVISRRLKVNCSLLYTLYALLCPTTQPPISHSFTISPHLLFTLSLSLCILFAHIDSRHICFAFVFALIVCARLRFRLYFTFFFSYICCYI